MTQEELSKLTSQQKRIRIAELLGAKWLKVPPGDPGSGFSKIEDDYAEGLRPKQILSFASKRPPVLPFPNAEGFALSGIPDYPNSLDAMHEAEKARDGEAWVKYRTCLVMIVTGQASPIDPWCEQDFVHASAAQRADAFLLTVG